MAAEASFSGFNMNDTYFSAWRMQLRHKVHSPSSGQRSLLIPGRRRRRASGRTGRGWRRARRGSTDLWAETGGQWCPRRPVAPAGQLRFDRECQLPERLTSDLPLEIRTECPIGQFRSELFLAPRNKFAEEVTSTETRGHRLETHWHLNIQTRVTGVRGARGQCRIFQ